MKTISKFFVSGSFAILLFLTFFALQSRAMPTFARRLGLDCAFCHTVVPKLNRTGYEFRLAGYRLPEEIGKEDKPAKLDDFFGARLQEQFRYKKHTDVIKTKNSSSSPLEFYEATLYPSGNGRLIFQTTAATGSPFFLWNLDEAAAEVAYYFGKSGTAGSARISNGILWKRDGPGTAEPA